MTEAPRTWATERLDEIVNGPVTSLPPVIQTLRLGGLDEWGIGWIRRGRCSPCAQRSSGRMGS